MMEVRKSLAHADEVGEIELLFSFPEGWDKAKGGPLLGEAVRVLGFERENCFEVAYIVSYHRRSGYAKMALGRLKACYGRLLALDVQHEAHVFHEKLRLIGMLDGYNLAATEEMAA
jgi:hypothetical protein